MTNEINVVPCCFLVEESVLYVQQTCSFTNYNKSVIPIEVFDDTRDRQVLINDRLVLDHLRYEVCMARVHFQEHATIGL